MTLHSCSNVNVTLADDNNTYVIRALKFANKHTSVRGMDVQLLPQQCPKIVLSSLIIHSARRDGSTGDRSSVTTRFR